MVKNKDFLLKRTSSNRRDFEIFAKGVERLEELRNELNSLNTSKYPEEVAAIRSKLKSVSYIPEIEQEMRVLKAKIRGNYNEKKLKTEINDEHSKIHRKIRELEKEIERKKKGVRRQVSKEELKAIKSIPNIKNKLGAIKNISKIEGQLKYNK
ncbi:MAG: hypothetical protein WCX73_04825, partial [Candidatus Pacearchaeota archaeon]